MQEEKVHVRLLIVAGVALLWMTAVFGRLGYVQLIRHSDYLARAQRQQQRTVDITPKRGAIYDRNMHPLAMSVPVESAFAVPTEIGNNKAMAARLLSGVLGIPRDVLETRFVRQLVCVGTSQASAGQSGRGTCPQSERCLSAG
jgi:cell division protein FtsI/penicillin-binding protein 2